MRPARSCSRRVVQLQAAVSSVQCRCSCVLSTCARSSVDAHTMPGSRRRSVRGPRDHLRTIWFAVSTSWRVTMRTQTPAFTVWLCLTMYPQVCFASHWCVLREVVLFLVTRLVAYWPAHIHAVAHANLYCHHVTSGRLAVCYSQIRSVLSSATAFPTATLRWQQSRYRTINGKKLKPAILWA